MSEENKKSKNSKIRNLVSGYYDTQKLRIATGNRIVSTYNDHMGVAAGESLEDNPEVKKTLDVLRTEYKRITDAYIDALSKSASTSISSVIKKLGTENLTKIHDRFDYDYIKSYIQLDETEQLQLKVVENEVKKHPLWEKFFKDVKGCGPLMAAVCLAYFDIEEARHVSSFWRYAGLDTVTYTNDKGEVLTEGRAKKHAKYTQVEYIDKETGEVKIKNSLGYNPSVKTKLVGVLGDCMIKAGLRSEKGPDGKPLLDVNGNKIQYANDSKYVQCYLDYRNRLNQRPDTKDYKDAHKHRMAIRYMIKQFLRDLWVTWRELEGLSISAPYEVDKLGMKPHKYNESHAKKANSAT